MHHLGVIQQRFAFLVHLFCQFRILSFDFLLDRVERSDRLKEVISGLASGDRFPRQHGQPPDDGLSQLLAEAGAHAGALQSGVASSPRWGSTTGGSGVTNAILYDVPKGAADKSQSPFFSIGQLQHADLTGDDDQISGAV